MIAEHPIKILMVMHSSAITGPNMATVSLLKAMDRKNYKVEVASPATGYFVERLKDIGIQHIPLEFGRYTDIITMLRLIYILRKRRYHILHGHMGRVGPIICLAGKIARVPAIILTEHMNAGSHTWLAGDPFRLFLHRLGHSISNNWIDKVIAVSEKARQNYIRRQGIREGKTTVIHNSIHLDENMGFDRTAVIEGLGLDKDAVIIGMFGRLIREKGYSDALLAAESILKDNQRVQFLIVGEGPERKNLERLAESKNLGRKVIFVGFRPDAAKIMEAIDILVQPSWTESAESFGLVLIEAMAHRKSVIASDIEPFFEIVEDGKSGFLFPEKEHKALAEKIQLLLNDKGLMERMGRHGYEIVKNKFSSDIIALKTKDTYKEVLRAKGYDNLCKDAQRNCPLCDSSDASFFIEAKGLDAMRNKTFQLNKCNSCGSIYLEDESCPEELKSMDFEEYYGSAASFYSGAFDFVMRIFILMRARKIEKMQSGGNVLDVGCGNGRFLKKMHSRGWNCYGVDVSPHAFEITGRQKGIKIFCKELGDIKLPENFFDAVTFWQSFEHIREPLPLLREVGNILKPDGILFISVPNVDSFEARISLRKWFGLELPRHAYQYSPKTIIALLENNGFSVAALNKNSLEYNFPFFAQTFFNALGGEFNFLYNFIKREKCAGKINFLLRLYTILLMVVLMPVVLLGTVMFYFINIVCGNGPVIEIFARKKQK